MRLIYNPLFALELFEATFLQLCGGNAEMTKIETTRTPKI